MTTDPQAGEPDSTIIAVGELVILRDGERGTVERVNLDSSEPVYNVRLMDHSERLVEADGIVRAKTYVAWVAPDSDWSGAERRRAGRRHAERRKPHPSAADLERRMGDRRKNDRRRP